MRQLISSGNYEELFSKVNYFAGLGVIGLGVLYFIFLSSLLNPLSWLYPTFFVLLGMMIISAQTKFGFIEDNFAFLQHRFGRGLFYIYTGTLCFNFVQPGNSEFLMEALAWIGFVVLALLGVYYILRGFKSGSGVAQAGAATDMSQSYRAIQL